MRTMSLFVLSLLSGCAHLVAMTPDVVHQDGRLVISAPPEKVFQAVKDALEAENIGVAIAKPENGVIVSKRFVLANYATNYATNSAVGSSTFAVAHQDTVQYDIEVKPTSSNVEVTVSPRGFHNDMEVTERAVWEIDGPRGQRLRWQRLFEQIKKLL